MSFLSLRRIADQRSSLNSPSAGHQGMRHAKRNTEISLPVGGLPGTWERRAKKQKKKTPRGESYPSIGRALELSSRDSPVALKYFRRSADSCSGTIHFALSLSTLPRFSLPFPSSCACTTASLSSWPWIVAITISLFGTLPRSTGTFLTTLRAGIDSAAATLRVVFPDRAGHPRGCLQVITYGRHLLPPISPAALRIELAPVFFSHCFLSDFISHRYRYF